MTLRQPPTPPIAPDGIRGRESALVCAAQPQSERVQRQFPVGPYIADFACRELIVELDGGQHADSVSDAGRTAFLNAEGYSRF